MVVISVSAAMVHGIAGVLACWRRAGQGPAEGRERGRGQSTHRDVSLMSAAERKEHQDRMRSMETYEECTAYTDQHREQVTTRAAQKGRNSLPPIRRDACAALRSK